MAASSSATAPDHSVTPTPPPPPPSYLLPYATLQPTYGQVYADVLAGRTHQEDVWLSLYADNAPQKSIHATLQLQKNATEGSSGVELTHTKGAKGSLQVTQRASSTSGPRKPRDLVVLTSSTSASSTRPTKLQNQPTLAEPVTLRLPVLSRSALIKGNRSKQALERGGGGSISGFDVSPQGSHFIVAGEDGEALLATLPAWVAEGKDGEPHETTATSAVTTTTTTELTVEERAQQRMRELQRKKEEQKQVPLKGHLGDLRAAKFFPSGQVVLTASADLTIRLYSLTGQNARTFKGHKRAITSLAMLGRGKRILSASLDGTIRLWDVATERCLRTIAVRNMSGVESLSLHPVSSSQAPPAESGQDKEEEEEGLGRYVLFAGLSSGFIDVFSLDITVLEAAKPAVVDENGEEEEEAQPVKLAVQDFGLLSVPPTKYPSDLTGSAAVQGPAATDFWSLVPSGAVWSMDVIVVEDSADHSTCYVAAGTKNGIVRLFAVNIGNLVSIVKEKESAAQAQGDVEIPGTAVGEGAEEQQELLLLQKSQAFTELLNLRRNPAGVTALRFVPRTGSASSRAAPDLVVATQDGTPFRVGFELTMNHDMSGDATAAAASERTTRWVPQVKEEYIGWEAGDAVECIALIPLHSAISSQSGQKAAAEELFRIALAGAEGQVMIY